MDVDARVFDFHGGEPDDNSLGSNRSWCGSTSGRRGSGSPVQSMASTGLTRLLSEHEHRTTATSLGTTMSAEWFQSSADGFSDATVSVGRKRHAHGDKPRACEASSGAAGCRRSANLKRCR